MVVIIIVNDDGTKYFIHLEYVIYNIECEPEFLFIINHNSATSVYSIDPS